MFMIPNTYVRTFEVDYDAYDKCWLRTDMIGEGLYT